MSVLCRKISGKRLVVSVLLVIFAMVTLATPLGWFAIGMAAVAILDLDKKFIQLVELFRLAKKRDRARLEKRERLRDLDEKVPDWNWREKKGRG